MLLPLAARYVGTARARARIAHLLAGIYPEDASSLATRAMVTATFAVRDGAPDPTSLARAAAAAYERLGWQQLNARALELAGDPAAVRATTEARPATLGFTEREREIAAAVAAGLANVEIAARLDLSVKTVESHLARIYAKLGLRSRVQLATYISENGRRPEFEGAD